MILKHVRDLDWEDPIFNKTPMRFKFDNTYDMWKVVHKIDNICKKTDIDKQVVWTNSHTLLYVWTETDSLKSYFNLII